MIHAASILEYLTSAKLNDGKWKGTAQSFILHWQDQARQYHEKTGQHAFPLEIKKTMLQNAVHPVSEL